jgi:predicted transcriptional regulator
MPRQKSDNTNPTTIKLPDEVLERAQRLADASNDRSLIGHLTRTDVLRAALGLGLDELEKMEKRVGGKRK